MRPGISSSTMIGESDGVDSGVVENWKPKLPEIIRGYALQDVYNMDELGIYYKATSTKHSLFGVCNVVVESNLKIS